MKLDSVDENGDYAYMQIGVEHQPGVLATWVLEKLPEGAYTGKVDGTVRPVCLIEDREQFYGYRRYLIESGVETGEIGGAPSFGGRVLFHYYDPDGNRLNVVHC